jgi:heat shock protein HslJ
MQKMMIGTLWVALLGLAALTTEAPKLVYAQQLPPAQRIQKPVPLTGTKWMLAETAGQHVAQDGRQPYFELKSVERYEDGSTGRLEDATDSCGNRLTGAYRASGDWLHVRIVSSTLLACKVSEGMPRRDLSDALTGDQRFRVHGNELDLLDNSGAVRARFIAANEE